MGHFFRTNSFFTSCFHQGVLFSLLFVLPTRLRNIHHSVPMFSVEVGNSLNLDAMLSANAVRTSLSANDSHWFDKFLVFSRVSKLSKCRQLDGDQLTTQAPLLTRTSDTVENKSAETIQKSIRERCRRVSVPGVLMNSFVLKKCVHYAQPIGGTELQ